MGSVTPVHANEVVLIGLEGVSLFGDHRVELSYQMEWCDVSYKGLSK